MEMTDYLLKFENPQEALSFAEANGYTTTGEDGNGHEVTIPLTSTSEYVFTVIGEYFIPTGETEIVRGESGQEWEQPITASDGKHWILFRDLTGEKDPSIAGDYIAWSSDQMKEGNIIPRPPEAPNVTFL